LTNNFDVAYKETSPVKKYKISIKEYFDHSFTPNL